MFQAAPGGISGGRWRALPPRSGGRCPAGIPAVPGR